MFPTLIVHFGFLTKEAFVLRTDAVFAALVGWEARSDAAWAAACQALVGGNGLAAWEARSEAWAAWRVLRGYVT